MLQTTTRENGTRRVSHVPVGETRTEQSHRQAVNINTIVAKARKGIPPRIQKGEGLYGDFTGYVDFHTQVQRLQDAKDDFMCLPARVRERFLNDPGRLLDFIADPANEDEARELGLLPDAPGRPLSDVERPLTADKDAGGTLQPSEPNVDPGAS